MLGTARLREARTHLEEVEECAGVEAGLLVDSRHERALSGALGGERGREVELEALGEVVLSLDLGAEDVGGGPRLGEDEAVGLVGVLCLDLAADEVGLRVLRACDLERDVGGRGGFRLEGGAVEVIVLAQEVVGGLAEILDACISVCVVSCTLSCLPSRTGGRAAGETWLLWS